MFGFSAANPAVVLNAKWIERHSDKSIQVLVMVLFVMFCVLTLIGNRL